VKGAGRIGESVDRCPRIAPLDGPSGAHDRVPEKSNFVSRFNSRIAANPFRRTFLFTTIRICALLPVIPLTSCLPSQQPRALRARHYRAEFVALKAADAPPPAVAFGQP
jgi:hypothetical protein